jgi:CDP-diglyceride synthetase
MKPIFAINLFVQIISTKSMCWLWIVTISVLLNDTLQNFFKCKLRNDSMRAKFNFMYMHYPDINIFMYVYVNISFLNFCFKNMSWCKTKIPWICFSQFISFFLDIGGSDSGRRFGGSHKGCHLDPFIQNQSATSSVVFSDVCNLSVCIFLYKFIFIYYTSSCSAPRCSACV